MPGKMARSTPRPAFGLRELLVAIHASRQSCYEAGKARIFTPVRESSGESRQKRLYMGVILPRLSSHYHDVFLRKNGKLSAPRSCRYTRRIIETEYLFFCC